MVRIEIDGQVLEVPQGQMVIEAADNAGISIPRFCYHKKLSIAANCRMCLVDVANAPKPLPACATPVADGMKIFTKTERAVDAQKAVMEFLLINHPLDCPICDQGGQCELQDLALVYGKDDTRYTESKRVVKDKNLGPLISTEMTRCIHCTRCVRFGTEVAGMREMGATGRGEFMEIGTFIEKNVNSEVSGNIIDLCPVGALTSKPFRFQARAWEMKARPSISPHDCVGSNLFFHVHRDKVMRTLPRENEKLNEVWLSDRDRFSYEAFNHPDRLTQPMIKQNGTWQQTDWETALQFAIDKLDKIDSTKWGVLASPNSTLEEFYLLQKLMRHKGCHHIDHRLRQLDFTHQNEMGSYPNFGTDLASLEHQEAIVLIGSDIQREQPLLALRLRKASLHGCKIFTINPHYIDANFDIEQEWVGEAGDFLQPLSESAVYEKLKNYKKITMLLGAYAITHPRAHLIYQASRQLAQQLDATWGEMSLGANSAGGWLAGCVPHRLPFNSASSDGLNAYEMLQQSKEGYLLFNVEPEDCIDPSLTMQSLRAAQAVVVFSIFNNKKWLDVADVILPISPISETHGTYVNGMGEWQTFSPVVNPLEQSKPGWKVLRVLGNLWQLSGFDYNGIEEVRNDLNQLHEKHHATPDKLLNAKYPFENFEKKNGLVQIAPIPLYSTDPIVRRATSLQQTQLAKLATVIRIHPEEAQKIKLKSGPTVLFDEKIPLGAVLVPGGLPGETWTY